MDAGIWIVFPLRGSVTRACGGTCVRHTGQKCNPCAFTFATSHPPGVTRRAFPQANSFEMFSRASTSMSAVGRVQASRFCSASRAPLCRYHARFASPVRTLCSQSPAMPTVGCGRVDNIGLDLEVIDKNLFRRFVWCAGYAVVVMRCLTLGFATASKSLWTPAGARGVYGGQVIGQALMAAHATLSDDIPIHSMHSYFLLPGDSSRPILYSVKRLRDGKSFTARSVIARQVCVRSCIRGWPNADACVCRT